MFQLQILVPLTGPTGHLQKVYNNHQHDQINPNVGTVTEITSKMIVPLPLNMVPPQYKTTKEKQHNLIKTFHKRFQDRRRQIKEISAPAKDNSNEKFDNFFSEFENLMMKDSDDSSAWLVAPNEAVINEVFIEGFHVLYNTQIGNLHTQALFDTGTSINAISIKFYSSMQQHLKILPTSRKVVSADGDSLGPTAEVHVKFKIGKVVLNDAFIILNNLQCDIILGLPWQQNYRIGCTGIKMVSISLLLKTNFWLSV